jgi:hypothetical protein
MTPQVRTQLNPAVISFAHMHDAVAVAPARDKHQHDERAWLVGVCPRTSMHAAHLERRKQRGARAYFSHGEEIDWRRGERCERGARPQVVVVNDEPYK